MKCRHPRLPVFPLPNLLTPHANQLTQVVHRHRVAELGQGDDRCSHFGNPNHLLPVWRPVVNPVTKSNGVMPNHSPFPFEHLRAAKGYSKRRLALALGMSPANYGRVESGQRGLSWETAQEIAEICGHVVTVVPIDSLPISLVGLNPAQERLVRRIAADGSHLTDDRLEVIDAIFDRWART